MVDRIEVYVELLDEGVKVWRPTTAFRVAPDIFVLSNENYDPEDEHWAVAPGSLIKLIETQASGGLIPVAAKFEMPTS